MKTYRWIIFAIVIALVPIGLASKFYQGPLEFWINNSFSSIFYEMFWIFLVVVIAPRVSPGWVSFWVFIITSALEFMQLWKPPFLQAIRATLMGRLLLGVSFVWTDFIYYVIGCTVGWLLLRSLKSKYVKG
ncbi:MAG: DUF2809 domain-containing protein [Cyanobacteriota bacterium]|nr:DUF2809 domain-containing protein [Cyanobacteriota bacterium]